MWQYEKKFFIHCSPSAADRHSQPAPDACTFELGMGGEEDLNAKRMYFQNIVFSVHIWIRCATEPLRIDGYRTRLHRTVHASADKQAI